MELYFLRHGIAAAAAGGDDAARPLTAEGAERMRCEAATLRAAGVRLDLIATSPLVRARETAEIVADALGMGNRIVVEPRLGPGFDHQRLAEIIASHRDVGALLLVGHEPSLSATIAYAIGGNAALELKPGSLARVDLPDPSRLRGRLTWLLPPAIVAR